MQKGFAVQGEQYILKPAYFDSEYLHRGGRREPGENGVPGDKIHVQHRLGRLGAPCRKNHAGEDAPDDKRIGQRPPGTSPKYPYSFRTVPCNENAFAQYVWMAKEYPQIKNVAHLNPSDEAGFTESATRLKCAKNVGYKNVANEFFKRGATDYYPVATRVIASKPDYIDLGGTLGRDQPLVVKALREIGFKGVIAVGYADPGSLVELAGATAEGTVLINSVTEPQNPKQKEVYDWYAKKYGAPVPGLVYDAWDPMFMFVEAVKKANSLDPARIS